MLQNYFNQLYYLDAGEIIVDYLACCLIEVLIRFGENPIYLTETKLAKIMRCSLPELRFSLDLLKSKDLINYHFSFNPDELLAGVLIITLNFSQINKINSNIFYKPTINDNSFGGFVYLIQKENSQEYKIGKSKDVEKRIKQLSTANYENLILIKSIFSLNYGELEKSLHKKYKHYRIEREWFYFDKKVLNDVILTLLRYE